PDAEEPAAAEEPTGEEDFELPDDFGLPEDFDLGDLEAAPGEEAAPAEEFGEEALEELFEGGAEEPAPAEEPGPAAETPSEPAEPEDEFALPEGGFDLDEDELGLPDMGGEDEFALPEPGAEDEFTLEEPGGEEPAPEGEVEADFGDLGGFEFSDEEGEEEFGGGEDFSFEEPSVPGAEPEGEEFGELDEVGEEDLDEFSLGDFGAEFGVLEEGESEEDLNPAVNVPEVSAGVPEAPSAPGEFQLSDDEFERMQRTVAGLPLNLKQEVERVIAEAKASTDDVEKLVRMLVAGESAQDIASFVSRIVGRRIRIPRGYEKRSGEEFERERESFLYQFRENIWPIVRLAAVFIVLAAGLAVAGYHLVFRPLFARSLYREGIELIEADQYSLGNQTFARAWEVWPDSDWYYDYADAFEAEREYTLAQEKYEQLLFGRDPAVREIALDALANERYAPVVANHPLPKRGVLEFADLESGTLGNYERANRLINLLLFRDTNDYDGQLALGDNYMRWAEEAPERHEDARLAYARLIEQYGQTDELLFRMLRYFIATDNLDEVLAIKTAFQNDPGAEINPEIYAELAGYLIDNDLLGDVEDVIFRAFEVDRTIPELHYHLARYYRATSAFGEEDLALDTAQRLLADAKPLTARRRAILVDTHTRIGENHYDAGNYLDAQEEYTRAIELYEQGRDRRILGPDAELARVYARLGDVFYYVGREYERALSQFDDAEANGYESSDLDYKQGFVHYRGGRLEEALSEFREAADDPAAETNALLWATANTHFRRDTFFASEAYYRELIDRVERRRDSIRNLLVDEDPEHQSVIEYLYRGYNNLGVALYELSEQDSDPDKYSQSLVYFTRSTELAENYQRDPATLSRSDAVDLAYLNQREALYPRPEYEMQIYNDIPEDLDDPVF
ncbi:MAG: periplasmic flagellar collar protein FlcA, partial [Spirochaetota bacterium]